MHAWSSVRADPVRHEEVAALQHLDAANPSEPEVGTVRGVELPGDLPPLRDLEDPLRLPSADQGVAARKPERVVHALETFVLPDGRAGGVELSIRTLALESGEHVTVVEPPDVANLSVGRREGRGHGDRSHDVLVGGELEGDRGTALSEKRVSIRQTRAAEKLLG